MVNKKKKSKFKLLLYKINYIQGCNESSSDLSILINTIPHGKFFRETFPSIRFTKIFVYKGPNCIKWMNYASWLSLSRLASNMWGRGSTDLLLAPSSWWKLWQVWHLTETTQYCRNSTMGNLRKLNQSGEAWYIYLVHSWCYELIEIMFEVPL